MLCSPAGGNGADPVLAETGTAQLALPARTERQPAPSQCQAYMQNPDSFPSFPFGPFCIRLCRVWISRHLAGYNPDNPPALGCLENLPFTENTICLKLPKSPTHSSPLSSNIPALPPPCTSFPRGKEHTEKW